MGSVFAWAATLVALAGTVLNCKKIKACFYLWLITNAMWLAWDVSQGLPSRALLDAVQFALAAWGIYEWSKDEQQEVQDGRSERTP